MLCDKCFGDGCKKCERGWIRAEPRKPNLESVDLFRAYIWLRNYHIMPISGGWSEQSIHFIWLVDFCDAVHSKWKSKIDEQNQINADYVKTHNR